MKYYFDSKELKNIFYSENEIFNIPFSVKSFFSEDNKKFLSTINFNLMKLNIENELIFENDTKVGRSKYYFNQIKRLVDYKIKKNSFDFHLFDKIDQPDITYKGKFNFKPFFANRPVEGLARANGVEEAPLAIPFGSIIITFL